MEYTSIRIAKPDRDALKAAADREGVSVAAKLHRMIEDEQMASTARAANAVIAALPAEEMAAWEADAQRAAGGAW